MSNRFSPKGRGQDVTGRSKGAGERHVRLTEWMMKSAAWQALTPAARSVYIEIERRYAGEGSNNGRIGLSVRTAAKACNITKDTAAKALRLLISLGFIECATPGGFSRKTPHAAEWRLTRAPCDVTGEPATKGFMNWRPKLEPTAERGPKSGTLRSQNKDSRPRKGAGLSSI